MTALDVREIIDLVSRRHFLQGSLALTAAQLLPLRAALAMEAYKFSQGDYEVTVFSDGHLTLPLNMLAPEAPPEELAKVAQAMGWSGDVAHPATNIPLLRSGDELILVDNGSGDKFQPTAGKLIENLKAAAIEPASVTKVVFTHAHPDHIWGTLTGDGLTFPNAAYYVGGAEWDFWMNPDIFNQLPADFHDFAKGAQRDLSAVKDRVTMIKAGDTIAPGITVLDTPGHTPGHIALEVSGGSGLIIAGDVTPNEVVSIEHPDWKFGFDAIPDMANATRIALVDRVATDKMTMLGYHFTYPGVGMVEKSGMAGKFVPAS